MATSTIITLVTLAVSSIISLGGGMAAEIVKEKEVKKEVAEMVKKNLK